MTNNNFKNFVEAMLSNKAIELFDESYVDDHDGKEYKVPDVVGFQVRGCKITPVYVSEKYSFSINPFVKNKEGKWHLSMASCGGTVMVSKWGSLEKAVEIFNQEHSYAPDKDHRGWSKEYIVIVRKDENGTIKVEF